MYREEKLIEIVKLFNFYGVREQDYPKLIRNRNCLRDLEKIVTPKRIKKEPKKLERKNNFESLIGKRFTRLIPFNRIVEKKKTKYLCKCDCGNKKIIQSSHLKNGSIKSCGCINQEKMVRINKERKENYEKKIKEMQEEYATISELSKIYPEFTISSIRWLIHKSKENGFYKLIHRQRRNIFINKKGFEKYVEQRRLKLCR